MFKLMLYWNVLPSTDEEYALFLSRELAPTMISLGINLTDAWFTLYGPEPQVRMSGVAEDWETLTEALESEEWLAVKEKLLDYVTDYREKVVRASGEFQL